MNPQELQQKIAEYYQKLTPEAQTVFSSMAWLETLRTISTKYNLTDAQIETLGTETTLALLGIIHLEEYENNLNTELALAPEIATKLITEIEDAILKEIRPQLIETFEKNNTDTSIEEQAFVNQDISENLKTLPEEIKNAILKSDYQKKLYQIVKENNFTVAQMDVLEKILVKVITGQIAPDKFEEALYSSEIKPTKEKSVEIVNKINTEILKQIRVNLMNSTEINKKTEFIAPAFTAPKLSEIQANEKEILSGTGIEIMPEESEVKMTTSISSSQMQNKNVEPKKIEPVQNPMPSMSSQRFSETFQSMETKTEHTLPGITPNSNIQPNIPRVDPYREIPS